MKKRFIALPIISLVTLVGCTVFMEPTSEELPTSQTEVSSKTQEDISEDTSLNTNQKTIETFREEMIEGLGTMELAKIRYGIPNMIFKLEQQPQRYLEQSIIDLQNIINASEAPLLKEDLVTVQKLLQHTLEISNTYSSQDILKIKDTYSLQIAIKMLSDLSYYGVDYPRDTKTPLLAVFSPSIYSEGELFGLTKSLGGDYSSETLDIISNINFETPIPNYSLEGLCKELEAIISEELSSIAIEKQEQLKEKNLEFSDAIYEMRQSLIELKYGKENLIDLMSQNKEKLINLIDECLNLLPEGKIKEEYLKVDEYLEFAYELISQETFNYDVVLMCIEGAQESLDDISATVLSNVEPFVNKRYSASLELFEEGPVLYDWIHHEKTGEYPDGGKQKTDFFNVPVYYEN